MMLLTTVDVSFCKDGRGSVNVKLWLLVVCVRYEVLCRLVVAPDDGHSSARNMLSL